MNVNSLTAQAQSLLQAQNYAAAIPLLREASKKAPKDPNVWFMLGIAQGSVNNLAAAEAAFRRTVELAPQAFSAWENLGRALMQLDQDKQAERCYCKAIELNPSVASAHAGLGELLRLRRDFAGSTQAFHTALNLEPHSPALHNQLGATLDMAGATNDAIQSYRTAVQLAPNFYDARFNLATALRIQGEFGQAVPLYQVCVQQNPQAVPAWFGLADSLLELNRWRESLDIYQRILNLDAQLHTAHLSIARICMNQGNLDAAQQHLDAASTLRHDSDPDVCALGAELAILKGEFEHARDVLSPALGKYPKHLSLVLAEATLIERTHTDPKDIINKLKTICDTLPLPPETLHFAMGRLYESAGQYDEAFKSYQAAHARRGMASDLQQHLDEMNRTEEFFTREFIKQLPATQSDDSLPIFIVGMPRSGTSLVEQILASHPAVYGVGESTKLWQVIRAIEQQAGKTFPEALSTLQHVDIQHYAHDYREHLRQQAPHARRICDKLPHNFLHLGLIQLLFPRATVIHCKRDPLDTCLSIFTLRFNINHRYAQNLTDLGRYYRRYEQIMAHWERTLDLNIHTLEYECLIADQEGETRRLLEATGLEWNAACLRFFESGRTVVTPSYDQVRRPLYSSSVKRWQRFEAHLTPLRRGLQSEET